MPVKLLPTRQLLKEAWGPAYSKETQYLRVYMTQLRHKLESDPARPRFLINEPGIGYRLKIDLEEIVWMRYRLEFAVFCSLFWGM